MDVIKDISSTTLAYLINESSYARKNHIETISADMDRKSLESLYIACREYACSSIVNHLTKFDNLKAGEIYHLFCNTNKFYILARVRTNWEKPSIEETAEKRRFLSFSILTEKNVSHYPGLVLYGFHNGVKPSMIGYIFPRDADTIADAKNRLELSDEPEILLDIEDLCRAAWEKRTYCQVSIESKTIEYINGVPPKTKALQPEVVIAIDEPTKNDIFAARQRKLPILVLHRRKNTIMNVCDQFPIQGLRNPKYL